MKKFLLLVIFAVTIKAHSQEVSVEKSIFGVQTGILGVWGMNESRLADAFALRSEIGLEVGIVDGANVDSTIFAAIPVVSAEPKWYYNLDKRAAKGKKTSSNNGNSVSLRLSYYPDWFELTNYDYHIAHHQLTIIPKWGIRRTYGNHFDFEVGGGIGAVMYFDDASAVRTKDNDVYVDLHLRIGYKF